MAPSPEHTPSVASPASKTSFPPRWSTPACLRVRHALPAAEHRSALCTEQSDTNRLDTAQSMMIRYTFTSTNAVSAPAAPDNAREEVLGARSLSSSDSSTVAVAVSAGSPWSSFTSHQQALARGASARPGRVVAEIPLVYSPHAERAARATRRRLQLADSHAAVARSRRPTARTFATTWPAPTDLDTTWLTALGPPPGPGGSSAGALSLSSSTNTCRVTLLPRGGTPAPLRAHLELQQLQPRGPAAAARDILPPLRAPTRSRPARAASPGRHQRGHAASFLALAWLFPRPTR